MTKLYKIIELLYKVTKLCNAINNKDIRIKFWQIYANKISCTFKFKNVALLIIKYKKN